MNPLDRNPYLDGASPEAGALATALDSLDERVSQGAAGDLIITVVPLLGTAVVILVLWLLMRVARRPAPTIAGAFRCPVTGRDVIAEFQLDGAARRLIMVNWCSAFVPAVRVQCPRWCLGGAFWKPSWTPADAERRQLRPGAGHRRRARAA
jgi:hypothetical protein